MPFTTRGHFRVYWKLEGEAERPPLVLLHSIGTDISLWDRAAPLLLTEFRLLRIDTRGHGASDAPAGDYRMADLAADVLAVMDDAGVERAHIAGVSLGGMIAMELALAAPRRVSALALICTSPAMDTATWKDRVETVRRQGTAAIAELAITRFLTAEFARTHPSVEQSLRRGLVTMADNGYAGAGAAIRDMEILDRLPALDVPTLIVVGDRDVSTPCAGHGDRLAQSIPGAKLVHLECAHLAPVEVPGELTAALVRFLLHGGWVEQAEETLFEAGLQNRRRVLGDEWVDRSLGSRTPFNSDFQSMITRIAWHEVWGRPQLDDRVRRLTVIAITAALGCWEEFRLHVRAGIEQGGFTPGDLKEVLMQTAIYAGVPAANTAFTEAGKILDEIRGST